MLKYKYFGHFIMHQWRRVFPTLLEIMSEWIENSAINPRIIQETPKKCGLTKTINRSEDDC